MVRPDTVATGWMGNICYYVSNLASGDCMLDGGDHTAVVTRVWCIDWVMKQALYSLMLAGLRTMSCFNK